VTRNQSKRFIISLPRALAARLEARGARPDPSRGPFNFSQQVARTVTFYESVVVRSDPRVTRQLSEDLYQLLLGLIEDPQALEVFHIHRLGDSIAELPDYAGRARAAGVDPAWLVATVNAYSYAEKLHLVDSSEVRQSSRTKRSGRP